MDRQRIWLIVTLTLFLILTATGGGLYLSQKSQIDSADKKISTLEAQLAVSQESLGILQGLFDGLAQENQAVSGELQSVKSTVIALEDQLYNLNIPEYQVSRVSGDLAPSLVLIKASTSAAGGSGFIVSTAGHVLTVNHGLPNINYVQVTVNGGEIFSGNVIARDPSKDLCLIKINTARTDFVPVKIGDPDGLVVGQQVLNIGFPAPSSIEGGVSVSLGIVSAFRDISDLYWFEGPDYFNWIQFDAASNPGNSGGALVNLDGEVVGIVDWSVSNTEGLNFALPINEALPFIGSYINPFVS